MLAFEENGALFGRGDEEQWLGGRIRSLVSRSPERDCSVLIEGEPGMGKSTLLAWAAREAERAGCQTLRMAATELDRHFPLRVVLDGLDRHSPGRTAHQAELADLLPHRDRGRRVREGGDTSPSQVLADHAAPLLVERLADVISRIAVEEPLALFLDDLHWTDEATLLLWQRLTRIAKRHPMLLVATSRRTTGRREVMQLRRGLIDRGARLLALGPMSPDAVAAMAGEVLGAVPDPRLRERLASARGNPFFVRELLDALRRAGRIPVLNGIARLTGDDGDEDDIRRLRTFTHRLDALAPATLEAMRMATLLGTDFAAADLAIVMNCTPVALLHAVEDAVAAGIVIDTGERMSFRHAELHHALYAAMPAAERSALHLRSAQRLHASGTPAEGVAEQLLQAHGELNDWAVDWIGNAVAELTDRAPDACVELLHQAVSQTPAGDARLPYLEQRLAEAAFEQRRPESVAIVRDMADRATEWDHRAALTAMLVLMLFWEGKWGEALVVIDELEAWGAGTYATYWAGRLRGLRAITLYSASRHEEAEAAAREVLAEPAETRDALAEAYARHALTFVLMRQRMTEAALAENAQTLMLCRQLSPGGAEARMRTNLLVTVLLYRGLMLGMTDQLEDALEILADAREQAVAAGSYGQLSGISLSRAALSWWTGRWDASLAELETIAGMPGIEWAPVIQHGITTLIHGHRDQHDAARVGLKELDEMPDPEGLQRAHSSYRIMAKALMAERAGRPGEALAVLLPTLNPEYARELDQRYQWLPDVVRLALQVGDHGTAQAAVVIATAEADREGHLGRRAAEGRCRGLAETDPEPLLAAVEYYRAAGRPFQAGQALEDTSVVLAALGDAERARDRFDEAIAFYRQVGAEWDIKRAHGRLRALGLRVGRPQQKQRTGWEALTPTELKVARLVAEGKSNPAIAAELYLSPRTVQTHVSHILRKLGLHSRTEVAREAAEHLNL
ncbi:LuxR C-terminal-related transcriptional regulator [Streptomyces sp. NPDC056632]|uniref:helix-turn-helix transcriptional regulator n=1 Tax=Streptomyces sp. NPDC056632 TaxID=3345884 RepID=UPI0036AE9B4D